MEEHGQEQAKRRHDIELEVIPAHETLTAAPTSPTAAEPAVVELSDGPPPSVVTAPEGPLSTSYGDDMAQVAPSATNALPLGFGEDVKLLPDMSTPTEAPPAKRSKTDAPQGKHNK